MDDNESLTLSRGVLHAQETVDIQHGGQHGAEPAEEASALPKAVTNTNEHQLKTEVDRSNEAKFINGGTEIMDTADSTNTNDNLYKIDSLDNDNDNAIENANNSLEIHNDNTSNNIRNTENSHTVAANNNEDNASSGDNDNTAFDKGTNSALDLNENHLVIPESPDGYDSDFDTIPSDIYTGDNNIPNGLCYGSEAYANGRGYGNRPLANGHFHDNVAFDSDHDHVNTARAKRQAVVSFVVEGNDEGDDNKSHANKHKKHEGQRKKDLMSALTSLLSVLYGGVLVLLGFAFPLAEALRSQWLTTTTVAVYNVYIYLVASIFLVYITLIVWRYQDEIESLGPDGEVKHESPENGDMLMLRVVKQSSASASGRSTPDIPDSVPLSFTHYSESNQPARGRRTHPSGSSHTSGEYALDSPQLRHRQPNNVTADAGSLPALPYFHPLTDEIYDEVMVLRQTASLGHDGASFYLRLGALLFGMANFIYVVVQIDQHFNLIGLNCYDLPEVYPMFFHLIFLVIQTFYIFKNTKVHVKRYKPLARFGYAHVLATNMCNWLRILVFEVMEGIYKTQKEQDSHKNDSSYSSYASDHGNKTSCLHMEGLYQSIAPYLFPFVLEYSLIAAATMAGMYQSLNVRVTQDILQAVKKAVWERRKSSMDLGALMASRQEQENMFSKSHRGMYGGAILLAGTLVSIIMFHFTMSGEDSHETEAKAYEIYLWSDITLHLLLIPPLVYCAVIFSKFRFTFNRENTIDDTLLLIALAGLVFYYSFILISGSLLLEEDYVYNKRNGPLSVVYAVLNIVQGVLQGVCVIAGLQLCANHRKQALDKPGRGALTFLIIGNLAIWLFKTFLVKEVSIHRFVDFYGATAWPIIMNTNLPLVLFYRFHVSVCLADMWASVYKPETGPKYKMLH